MSWIDIDVIAKPGKKDLALQAFRDELEKEATLARVFGVANDKRLVKDVVNINEMVTQIIATAGSRPIRRLRIYGHGSPNTVQIGPFALTGRRLEDFLPRQTRSIDPTDYDKVIQLITTETRTAEGNVVNVEHSLLNDLLLRKLAGRFDPRGWVELHSCRIVRESGKALIDALAKLWGVQVHASEENQSAAGGLGFQGRVWIGAVEKKPFPKVSLQTGAAGATPVRASFQVQYDPMAEATRRLQTPGTGAASMQPGATYSDLTTRRIFEVDGLGTHAQTSASTGAAHRRVGAPPTPFILQRDPLRDAARSLRLGSSTLPLMPVGTTYSDLSTRRTFEVDRFGQHDHAGARTGLAAQAGLGTTARTFQSLYDPLRDAADRLQGGSSRWSAMQPGTTYSDLTTRHTFTVDTAGRHMRTDPLDAFASRLGGATTAQSFQSWQNPMREAVRRLGG